MNLRSISIKGLAFMGLLAWMGLTSNAQVAGSGQAGSATHVAAEMTKGKLNPEQSKPGDQVALKLQNDVRANGDVVLKKGTTITGVVRNVKRIESKGRSSSGQAQSMMEIEWFAPATQGGAAQQVSIALQSVTQVNPIYAHEQESAGDDFGAIAGGPVSASGAVASTAHSGGGLLAGAAGATTGVAAGAAGTLGGVTSNAGAAGSTVAGVGSAASTTAAGSARAGGQSNAALLSMPSIVAADHQTAVSLENTFGMESSSQLYKVGRGELITAGGSKQSVDLFTHLSNDTVITSQSRNFEISSGAQMQLLVGVNKK